MKKITKSENRREKPLSKAAKAFLRRFVSRDGQADSFDGSVLRRVVSALADAAAEQSDEDV